MNKNLLNILMLGVTYISNLTPEGMNKLSNLSKLVYAFRRVMEQSTPSDFNGTSLSSSQFPCACCDDSSLILAAYLVDNGIGDVRLITGGCGGKNGELNSHVWLTVDSLQVDITADQFNGSGYNNPPVILEANNNFLSTFKSKDSGIADFRQHLLTYSDKDRLLPEFEECYEVIQKKLGDDI